jgi:hypothetical protein
MLKSIFKLILNRRRSNSWMAIELLLVFILIWYMADYFFVLNYNYHIPNYRNTKQHTWQVKVSEYPDSHASYRADQSHGEALEANYARLLQALKDYPEIEAVSVITDGFEPESGSYGSYNIHSVEDSARTIGAQRYTITSQEDFFRVFGYTTDAGRTPVSVRDFDWSAPNSAVIGRMMAEYFFPDDSPIGKKLSDKSVVIGVVDDVKRFDYERPQHTYYRMQLLDSIIIRHAILSVRSRASISDALFLEAFKKEMTGRLQTGNFYLKSVIPYGKIASNTKILFGMSSAIRERTGLMIFFLLNILLCVMGTFWYRIHTRREEIGIRKAMGATSAGIRNGLLLEGLCLLLLVVLPAMLIEYQFVHADLIETLGKNQNSAIAREYLPDRTFLRFLITNGITFAVMAAVIVVAIWLPARKAAALPAAEALHYE